MNSVSGLGGDSDPLCIFCAVALGPETPPEHIVLNALGGRKTSRRVLCGRCNNRFGRTIDADAAAQVAALRNMAQFPSGSGDPPPPLRKIQAGDELVHFDHTGTPILAGTPWTILKGEGETRLEVNPRSPEHMAEILPNLAAHLGLSIEATRTLLAKGAVTRTQRRVGPVKGNFNLGGELAVRSMAKSCLTLLASAVGSVTVRGASFDAIRRLVEHGEDAYDQRLFTVDARRLPVADVLEARFGAAFNALYITSDEQGRTIGHFTLYNLMGWRFHLTDAGGPANVQLGLFSNPAAPAIWSDDPGPSLDVPFAWLDSDPDVRLDSALQPRLDRFFTDMAVRARERALMATTREVLARFGVAPEDPPPDAATHALIVDEIVTRASAWLSSTPLVTPVTTEEVEQWFPRLRSEDGAS